MIGYTNNGYRLWNPKTKTIISAINVIFDENTNFPGQETPNTLLPDVDPEENVPETNIKESKPEFPELEGHVNREKPKVGTQPIRSTRTVKPPIKFDDYEMDMLMAMSVGDFSENVPETYEDAIDQENHGELGWKQAIKQELEALENYNTWTIVPKENVPKEEHVIDSK